MLSSLEKPIRNKNEPPEAAYIKRILIATHASDTGIGKVFRTLTCRLSDPKWTVILRRLMEVHLMIREGSPGVTVSFLSTHVKVLCPCHFLTTQPYGAIIQRYANYLAQRTLSYCDTGIDWVREPELRLENASINKRLFEGRELVQEQLSALVECNILETDPGNEISIAVFRLLVLDLLELFQALNQRLIHILEHFFELSKPNAQRAVDIYNTFVGQTECIIRYLYIARLYEYYTGVEMPTLERVPVNLGRLLENYLMESDFETRRRRYLTEKVTGSSSVLSKSAEAMSPDVPKSSLKPCVNKDPEPDLIDFSDSTDPAGISQSPVYYNPIQVTRQDHSTKFGQPQQSLIVQLQLQPHQQWQLFNQPPWLQSELRVFKSEYTKTDEQTTGLLPFHTR